MMRMKIRVLPMRQRTKVIPRRVRVGVDTQPIPHRPILLEFPNEGLVEGLVP